jgi:hypothetical protein
VRGNLNKFLASDDGVSFVHAHDRTQVERLLRPGDGNKDLGGAHKRAAVNVEQALNTPVEQSDQKLQAANLAIGKELQQARQAELERGMDLPNRGGPAMA